MKKIIKKTQYFLLLLFPPAMFLSYYPIILLGRTDSMNLELSISLIWLALFALINLFNCYRFFKDSPKFYSIAFFSLPIFTTLSLCWTANLLRGILTVGIFWLIFISIFAGLYLLKNATKIYKIKLIKSLLFSTVAVALFCLAQFILDTINIQALLCAGCTYTNFGFPRVTGFAIEPQFMGGLLLAPILVTFYLLLHRPKITIFKHHQNTKLTIILLLSLITLFLTFSRGAIYSLFLGLIVFFCYEFYHAKKHQATVHQLFIIPLIFLITFFISLSAQGIAANIARTSDDFYTATTKAIHHLSLGIIDFRSPVKNTSNSSTETTLNQTPTTLNQVPTTPDQAPTFSGYVAESTNIRMNLNQLSLNTSMSHPKTFLIGAGIGGAGTVLFSQHPSIGSSKEIVQNEYLQVLLELGSIGAIIALICCGSFIYQQKFLKNSLGSSLLIAYAASLLFFSGFPNALYLFLAPLLIFAIISVTAKN